MNNNRKVVCTKLSSVFREATSVIECPIPQIMKPTEILVRNAFAGVNASDINYTSGRYLPGVRPPFDCGFEGIGTVAEVGSGVKNIKAGDFVVVQSFGTFSKYQVVPSRSVKVVPSLDPAILPLELSGCTAAIALGEVGKPQAGETALVTAAAGGTGQFAVQLLKRAGCRVAGTCSSEDKAAFLRSIGCDVVINYKKDDVDAVLSKEFPTGVNIVYESVGGSMLETALRSVALKGRIITIGSITGYQDGSSFAPAQTHVNIPTALLQKSAMLRGFFLPHYGKFAPRYFQELVELHANGDIKVHIDSAAFASLDRAVDAVEHLHSGKSIGKVVVATE